MYIFKKAIVTILMITSGNFLFALNPIYLEISDCAKEYKYAYTELSDISAIYYTYHFELNEYETVIFEASSYQTKTIAKTSLPAKNRLTCSADLQHELPTDIVENFHAGSQTIYLLKSNDDSFEVLNVTDVTYQVYLSADNFTRINAGLYSFDYDSKSTANMLSNVKLKEDVEVNFTDKGKVGCLDKFVFEYHFNNHVESSNVEYLLGIGMFKQYSKHVKHQLISIDNQPIGFYIANLCQEIKSTTAAVPTKPIPTTIERDAPHKPEAGTMQESDVIVVEDFETFVNGTLNLNSKSTGAKGANDIYISTPVTRQDEESNAFHTVKSGETLYSISKQYKLTVAELKLINQLSENDIEIGQKLKIRE